MCKLMTLDFETQLLHWWNSLEKLFSKAPNIKHFSWEKQCCAQLSHFSFILHVLQPPSWSVPQLVSSPPLAELSSSSSSSSVVFITSFSYPRFLSAPLLYPERGPWSLQLPVSQKTPLFPPSVFPPLPPHPLPQHPCGTFPPSPLVHSSLTSAGWGVPLSESTWAWAQLWEQVSARDKWSNLSLQRADGETGWCSLNSQWGSILKKPSWRCVLCDWLGWIRT